MSILGRLNQRAATLRTRKQSGFTLLELLVVVAILAAIAGTAALALRDTDARASAAAHVAMMDELNKGLRSFRVLNRNAYPTRFDSLLQSDGTVPGTLGEGLIAIEDIAPYTVTAGMAGIMEDIGVDALMYLDATATGSDFDCSDGYQTVIESRGNAVVAGNIFMTPAANGCGVEVTDFGTTAPTVAVWTGGSERIIGNDLGTFDGSACTATEAAVPVYMTVGMGPSSTLFDTTNLGGMTSVPVYRHVAENQYNRFIALFQLGTCDGTNSNAIADGDQLEFIGVVDGAGDTKEEELGEWDGTRNTI